MIRKTSDGQWGVYTSEGKLIKKHATRAKALVQLRAIEASKHQN